MTAISDPFKDIVPPLLPFPHPLFTMFAPAEILISFQSMCGRYRRTTSEEELAQALPHSDPETDGFADQLQHCTEPEGSDYPIQSGNSGARSTHYEWRKTVKPRLPFAAWLGETDDGNLKESLVPYPAEQMRMWEISPRVNSPKNDDPSLWGPLHAEATKTTTDALELLRE
jgi:putative SOS response-associated peptidase YedK